jgi:hydrogenase maturation protease
MTHTLVLGLGNPFRGDDGIGPEVVAALRQETLSPDVTIIDGGTPGLETVLIWQNHQRVIVVDAADMGLDPGRWKRFLPEDAIWGVNKAEMQGTMHSAGLAEALALAEALDMLPPELIFYGIQPARLDWSVGLSSEVQPAVTAVSKSILHELNSHLSI